ncbi:MAG: acylphosphatase [Geminicoccaceae bacterium]|nr:acylphosphatase [Geminicoccaceae bacterium]
MADRRVRVIVHGDVQGVFYRGWTVEQARALRLRGWVRNRHDGTVEALFSGPGEAVDEMVRRCQDGPPAARVSEVEVEDSREPVPEGFGQRGTA